MIKDLNFEVYRTAAGDLRGRLYRRGTFVAFPPNGLPKHLDAEDRVRYERNVKAALEAIVAQPAKKLEKKQRSGRKAKVVSTTSEHLNDGALASRAT